MFRLPKSIAFVKDAFDPDNFDESAEAAELANRWVGLRNTPPPRTLVAQTRVCVMHVAH